MYYVYSPGFYYYIGTTIAVNSKQIVVKSSNTSFTIFLRFLEYFGMARGKSTIETDKMSERAANVDGDNKTDHEIQEGSSSSSTPRELPTEANKEQIMSKIKNVPISKLKDIITDQIDLEIRLKHKELTLTEEEIGKCESQMITLRNYYQVPREKLFESEPNDFTLKYYDLLNRSLSVNYTQPDPIGGNSSGMIAGDDPLAPGAAVNGQGHVYRTRSTTSSLRPTVSSFPSRTGTIGCLYRRTDGIIVKLTCPDCKRTNFSSAQGFLNHSRIAHTQEYTSQDAAALICGEILPDNEQDEEGLASIKSLKEKGLDPNKNLNVNEIYFNGLSNTLNTVHRSSIDKSVSPLDKENSKLNHEPKKPEESELMKKLIKNGITKDKKCYEELIESYKNENVAQESSEEEEEEEEMDTSTIVETTSDDKAGYGDRKLKRRRSRAFVGIVNGTSQSNQPEHQQEEDAEEEDVAKVAADTVNPPLPKMKLKLKPDKKKRKQSA